MSTRDEVDVFRIAMLLDERKKDGDGVCLERVVLLCLGCVVGRGEEAVREVEEEGGCEMTTF